ncbi:MAG: hypothetical protein SLAVMIC_00049 [uncultured marine phage]|uniref:Uncharacterized protein n=1 Tax=uncultured marine phage TaxID=707152 RepID=A0A8D9C9B5_9VIRU|nr:MAG: hypothetical protein SLAVMIC_00049 [uncultured marine phage]
MGARANGYYECKKDFTNGLNVPYVKKGDIIYVEFPPVYGKLWTSSEDDVLTSHEFFIKKRNGKDPLYKTGYQLAYFAASFKKSKNINIDRYDKLDKFLNEEQ